MSLPRPLLELAWMRLHSSALLEAKSANSAFSGHSKLQKHQFVRHAHALAVARSRRRDTAATFTPHSNEPAPLQSKRTSLMNPRPKRDAPPPRERIELHNRIGDLLNMPVEEVDESLDTVQQEEESPALTEEQLRAIYVDLLTPIVDEAEEDLARIVAPEARLELLEALEARLALIVEESLSTERPSEGLAAKLSALRHRLVQPGQPPAALDAPEEVIPSADELMEPSTLEVSPNIQQGITSSFQPITDFKLDRVPLTFVPTVQHLNLEHPWNRVLARLDVMLDQWKQHGVLVSTREDSKAVGEAAADEELVTVMPIGLSVITLDDWTHTLQAAIEGGDILGADITLSLMQRARVPVDLELKEAVVNMAARTGNIAMTENMILRHYGDYSSLTAKYLHVKSYARAGHQSDACRFLHEYEAHGKILPMKTYQIVISSLFYGHGPGRSQRRAQAWDLFAHMRYVAHPVPDVQLYSTMIRSCAMTSGESDALRAMDLWNEMIDDQRLTPDVVAYNAIIAACSRHKGYLVEAFRLARSMIEGSRDAHGVSHMVPTYETFMGLLQAAKRMGALSRARWLFAEVLRCASLGHLKVNDMLMQQLFHSYASYNAPSRKGVPMASERAGEEDGEEPAPLRRPTNLVEADGTEEISSGAPSKAQVVTECEQLFKRVLEERERGYGLLSQVQLSTRLANAYASTILNQSNIDHGIETFRWLHTQLGIPPDTRSYHQIFACLRQYMTNHSDLTRNQVVAIAQELWQEWRQRYPDPPTEALRLAREPLDAPTSFAARKYGELEYIVVDTENIWKSMIEILALAGRLDESMQIVRAFAEMYPPTRMRIPQELSELRNTKISLLAKQPLVRLSTPTAVADDTVPPMLLFPSVHLLHHQLVVAERPRDIAYLTWLTTSYKAELTRRRDSAWARTGPGTAASERKGMAPTKLLRRPEHNLKLKGMRVPDKKVFLMAPTLGPKATKS